MSQQKHRILSINAHPHDFTHSAGTLGIHAAKGDHVTVVSVTSGAFTHNEELRDELLKDKDKRDASIVNVNIDKISKTKTLELEKACKLIDKPVRNDKHLNSIYAHINKSLLKEGRLKESRKIRGGGYTKNFDIVFSDKTGKHAIELKSISSSFGKNCNNRIEEMTGQAFLSKHVLNLKSFSYIFVVNETKEKIDNKYITRLKECATTLFNQDLLKNFVLLRIKKSHSSYEDGYNFKNWAW